MALGRIPDENSIIKRPTRKNSAETPKITTGTQGKRGLEGNFIRKKKLEAIMLDGKVLKAEYYKEEE